MGTCNCIQGLYDFDIKVKDCRSLLYQGFAIWDTIPESYSLQVIAPNGTESNVEVITKGFTELNSIVLNNTADKLALADGIYCFTVENCGKSYKRHWLNTCTLECCVEDYIIKMLTDCEKDDIDEINKIERLIEAAKYSAINNMKERSIDLYTEAKISIEDLNCDCKCLK